MRALAFFLLLQFFMPLGRAQVDSIARNFNYQLGTQTFGASYGFTGDTRLVETAKAIRTLGSDILKFHLKAGVDGIGTSPKYADLDSLIHLDPSLQYVFDSLNFQHYFMWARSFNHWYDGYSAIERTDDSLKIYNLTKYLLEK